jgi:hypothetical protein
VVFGNDVETEAAKRQIGGHMKQSKIGKNRCNMKIDSGRPETGPTKRQKLADRFAARAGQSSKKRNK